MVSLLNWIFFLLTFYFSFVVVVLETFFKMKEFTKIGSYPLILPRSLDFFFKVSSIVSLFCKS